MALTPVIGSGVSIDVSDSSARASLGDDGQTVVISNDGDSTCWFRFGGSTATAVETTDAHIKAGQTHVLERARSGQTHLAAIAASGATTTLLAYTSFSE